MIKKVVACRACGAPIVFLKTRKVRQIPCDEGTVLPEDVYYDADRHVSHFATCPEAKHFRRQHR
jgi:hypothetical protein